MSFSYSRTIRFQDTDAAGVVYFANVLAMCHEAYEESLFLSGVDLRDFFSNSAVAIPIVHANVDFFRPMFCGDNIIISLSPRLLEREKFEISYKLTGTDEKAIANAVTKHVCIDPISRTKKELPQEIMDWLENWADSAAKA